MLRNIRNNTSEESLIKAREIGLKKNKEELLGQEIKKTEALRSQLLSNVSHELKTPLTSILTATSLLRKKSLDKESKELLEIIDLAGQQLGIALNNVLDYYKLNNNLLSLDNIRFDLISMLRDLHSLYIGKAQDKGLDLDFEVSENLTQFVIGDEIRLRQILSNVLENAIKFTDKGSIKLESGVIGFHDNFNKVYFRISDTGSGISENEAKNLWRSFSVGDESNSRRYQGLGMGLILSKRLCELMGGDVFIKKTGPEGSTFEVHVLLEVVNQKHENNKRKETKKILLVEDSIVNQMLTKNLLTVSGFEVDIAENGLEAIRKFKCNIYDMILMDIQMPVMDGITACKEIRSLESSKEKASMVKIFAFTANGQQQDKNACLAAGMNGYLSKPLNSKEISRIFDNLQFTVY